MNAIPLAGAAGLRGLAHRRRAARAALALVLVGTIVALALAGRSVHDTRGFSTLPLQTDAIIVLDVSASDWETGGVGRALQSVVDKGGHYGLVLESNQAYLAMPPGTPAADFKPLLHYFVLPTRAQHGFAPTLPPNPWEPEFTSGDDFSLALTLAAQLAIAQPGRTKPGVIFISDLGDGPDDWNRLPAAIAVYTANHIALRVVATDPDAQDVAFFQRLLGNRKAVITINTNAPPQPRRVVGGFPQALVALVVGAAVLLALGLFLGARLTWDNEGTAGSSPGPAR
jgi:hypothetical protein